MLYGPKEDSPLPVPNSILRPAGLAQPENLLGGASQNKLKLLQDFATGELLIRLAERYTDVLPCLRCLDLGSGADQDGNGFGVGVADWTDANGGVIIEVRYIENVLEKMQDIMM